MTRIKEAGACEENLCQMTSIICLFIFSPIGQEYPYLLASEINRIYDGVEASTRKSQASFQII